MRTGTVWLHHTCHMQDVVTQALGAAGCRMTTFHPLPYAIGILHGLLDEDGYAVVVIDENATEQELASFFSRDITVLRMKLRDPAKGETTNIYLTNKEDARKHTHHVFEGFDQVFEDGTTRPWIP